MPVQRVEEATFKKVKDFEGRVVRSAVTGVVAAGVERQTVDWAGVS